jgi:hypothetical protein
MLTKSILSFVLLQALPSIILCKPTNNNLAFVPPTTIVADPATKIPFPSSQRRGSWQPLASSQEGSSDGASPLLKVSGSGLYRKFADHAWDKLQASGLFDDAPIPSELTLNQAPAKGTPDSVVQISTKALVPKADESSQSLVRYARVALLETIAPPSATATASGGEINIHTNGIQVLNLVVIPSDATSLPVLGIDLVSLPGNRHLLLLDAQPMTHPNPFEDHWKDWYAEYVTDKANFPWGGDFPEPVQQYVSKYSLWTRLQELEDPVSIIQGDVWDAFVAHLDVYMDLLGKCNVDEIQGGSNHQPSYLEYRRNNDPAKPMLNSLYGAEWTNRVLEEVLFPQS